MILHWNPSAIARDFSPHMAVLRRLFLPNAHSRCCSSRPIGVRVCLVAQLDFFSTAFGPRAWTTVVFWKDDAERQPPLFTPENEGGDDTSSPSPPKFTFSDDPDVLFRPRPRGPFDQPPPDPHRYS